MPPKMQLESFANKPKDFSNSLAGSKNENSSSMSKSAGLAKNSPFRFFAEPRAISNHASEDRNQAQTRNPNAFTISSSSKQALGVSSLQSQAELIARPNNLPGVLPNPIGGNTSSFVPSQGWIGSPPNRAAEFRENRKDLDREESDLSNGTGNAPRSFYKDESAYFQMVSDTANDLLWKHKQPLSEEQLAEEIKGFLSDAPFPCSHQNGVLRFALSLQNGSSVSVRIEQMKEHLQVCFISEDKQVLQSLSKSFNSSMVESHQGQQPLEVHFFRSYQHMDNVLSSTPFL